jgi:glycine cleavage system H protein
MAEDFPAGLRYTETDEWVRREDGEMVSGITAFAAEQLGDVVYVQLPEAGKRYGRGESFGEIESVKAVSDLYCPLAAEIIAVNDQLDQNPGLINDDPYGDGWMVRFRPDNASDYDSLLDADAYRQNTAERH